MADRPPCIWSGNHPFGWRTGPRQQSIFCPHPKLRSAIGIAIIGYDFQRFMGFLTYRMHVDEVARPLLAVLNPIEAIFRIDFIVLPGLTIARLIEEVVAVDKIEKSLVQREIHELWPLTLLCDSRWRIYPYFAALCLCRSRTFPCCLAEIK